MSIEDEYFSIQSEISNEYGILSFILKIFGIEIFKGKKYTKMFSILKNVVPFLMYITVVYVAYQCIIGRTISGTALAFFISCALSLGIWHSIHRKRSSLCSLFIEFHKIEIRQKRKSKNRSSAINFALTFTLLTTFISALMCVIFLDNAGVYMKDYYSFNNISHEHWVRHFVRGIISQLTTVTQITLPAVATVLCCGIYYKCSDLFEPLIEDVKGYQLIVPCRYVVENLMHMHRDLYKLTHHVEVVIRRISFLILVSHMLSMYLGLSTYVLYNKSISTSKLFDSVSLILLSPTLVVAHVLCGSRVASQITKMQYNLQIIHYNLAKEDHKDWRALEMLKIMLSTSYTIMSAGGFVEFRAGLILSAFGSLFSYGLLILSIRER